MLNKKANAPFFHSLEDLHQKCESLQESRNVSIHYRKTKVTASCKIGKRHFSGIGQNPAEAFTALEMNVSKEFNN